MKNFARPRELFWHCCFLSAIRHFYPSLKILAQETHTHTLRKIISTSPCKCSLEPCGVHCPPVAKWRPFIGQVVDGLLLLYLTQSTWRGEGWKEEVTSTQTLTNTLETSWFLYFTCFFWTLVRHLGCFHFKHFYTTEIGDWSVSEKRVESEVEKNGQVRRWNVFGFVLIYIDVCTWCLMCLNFKLSGVKQNIWVFLYVYAVFILRADAY